MTTNELIEKYGIGHNCLSDAYALGMMHGLDGMENAVRLAEEKARVDAIEEAKAYLSKKIDEMDMRIKNAEEKADIMSEHYFSGAMWHLMEVKEFLEQLKEKKNE